ncbi:MAG: polyphosphate polymerase domain-containing protein [Cytophagales bacterium]|nr:polyphosphate polymerase domain-containing protein [Cytophagales bacterium]
MEGMEPKLLNPLVEAFEAVSLAELEAVKLLNRADTKFVLHTDDLPALLGDLAADYQILEIGGRRVFAYETVYFDTDDFGLYRLHHNGKPDRLKVRYRQYLDSGEVFFELKRKVKNSRTDKHRLSRPVLAQELSEDDVALLPDVFAKHFPLKKKLCVRYQRLTLVNRDRTERLTLDLNLAYDNFSRSASYPHLVIAELKQNRASLCGEAAASLRRRGHRPTRFSKYAIGIALLEPVKHNNFKPCLLILNKISAKSLVLGLEF